MAAIQTETDIDEGLKKYIAPDQEQLRNDAIRRSESKNKQQNVQPVCTQKMCIWLAVGATILMCAGVVLGITVVVTGENPDGIPSSATGPEAETSLVIVVVLSRSPEIPVTTAETTLKPEEATGNKVSNGTGSTEDGTCLTTKCYVMKEMVGTFKKHANVLIDPCVNFEEYACGRFSTENSLPENGMYYNNFVYLADLLTNFLREYCMDEIDPDDPHNVRAVKIFYKSCTNEEKVEEKGVSEFLKENITKDWPTLQPAWREEDFDLNDVIVRHEAEMVEPLFKVLMEKDEMNPNTLALHITEPTLPFDRKLYLEGRNSSLLMAYEAYLAKLAVLLGADDTVANQDAKDVVNFEIALSTIMVPEEEKRNAYRMYNPVILNALAQAYRPLDITKALKIALVVANLDVIDNTTVINRFPRYLENVPKVLQNFSNRTIRNYFGFFSARTRLEGLTKAIRNLSFEVARIYTGITKPKEHWRFCVDEVSIHLSLALNALYFKEFFLYSEINEEHVIVTNVKEAFKSMVMENTWTSQATKDEALAKLNALVISHRVDINVTQETLDFWYQIALEDDDFYGNRLRAKRAMFITPHKTFLTPVIRNEWQVKSFEINAFYFPTSNEIVYSPGMLHRPFISDNYIRAKNYGTFGVFVGHEITHGFDDKGRQYDASGKIKNWWTQEDEDHFHSKTDCFVQQFGNFTVPESGENINGVKAQGEAMADTEGVRAAYRAYKNATANETFVPLPGLDLTQDQIFFLSYAQTWCEIGTVQYYKNVMKTVDHPPFRYRILGALQNNKEFAKAFQCAQNTYMNPENKCTVW